VLLTASQWPAICKAQEPAKSDQERLQGTWECIAAVKDGKQVTTYVGVRATMQGNRLTWTFPQPGAQPKVMQATFRIDSKQNPKHFDWYVPEKPNDIHRRLYILKGDVLIWSTNLGAGERPTSFVTGQWQFVMNRVSPRK
jgi:uncharacterized protein (TIGR03067 family)